LSQDSIVIIRYLSLHEYHSCLLLFV